MSIQVKPLEWTQKAPPGREHEPFVYWAAGLGGHYSAEPDGLLWMADDEFTWQQHPTQAAAKAAAQADYETRIRSALHTTPTPVSAPVGVVEMATAALEGLIECHDAFNASYGNMEDAYYKLAKYAYPKWHAARDALAALRSPAVESK